MNKNYKVLLTTLNSKFVHSNLAIKYLYNDIRDIPNLDISIFEYTINNSYDYIFSEIIKGNYDAVCFSCYIWNIETIKNLISDLRKAQPDLKIILGGPEVSYDIGEASAVLKYYNAHYIIQGPGENVLANILSHLADGLSLPYDVYNNTNGDDNFAHRPFPYSEQTFSQNSPEKNKILYYETSRGCPFRCSYCMSSIDKTIRALPVETVKQELQIFLNHRIKQVKFIDRTFNYDKKRSLEIFNYLIANDNGKTNFHMEICADLLDKDIFNIISQARQGLFQFEIGIQTTNPQTLEAINRKSNTNNLLANIKKLIALGNAHIHIDLIAGLPYENLTSFKRSFNDVYALHADNLQLGFLKLLKGTPILSQVVEHGYFYQKHPPYEIIANNYITAKELVTLKEVEKVLNLYHNKGGFVKTLSHIIATHYANPYDFYEDFGRYFHQMGHQHVSHSKMNLYRILFAFGNAHGYNLQKLLIEDMQDTLIPDEVARFKKHGWELG